MYRPTGPDNMMARQYHQQGPRPGVPAGSWEYPPSGGPSGAPDPNCKTIRIRNLALDTSEDDLRRIFSQLGTVADLWVVVDKYENQIGTAYCEFRDAHAVQIAVSHLNGVSFKGHQIQIDPTANHTWKNERSRTLQAMEEMVIGRNGSSHVAEAGPSDSSASHDPSSDLTNLNSEQMFNLMHQMKLCIEASADHEEARNALLRNFTLTAGMLQALLMMKLVDPQDALNLLMREDVESSPAVPPAAATSHPTLLANPSANAHMQNAPPGYIAPPSVRPPPQMPLDPRQARLAQAAQDPYGRGYPPPANRQFDQPSPVQSAAPEALPNQSEIERATMLLQLIQMTDQQLASLPPDQRQAVMMLRDQLSRQQMT